MAKQATFRFYEELNDFLPSYKKKVAFLYSFFGTPSVKDVIEALGIPHVEVDLILVNSISVDFKYTLQNNDFVSVYPVFETLDISDVSHLRNQPLRETKFILDVHLGKLAKYLRTFGFDTMYQNDYDDREIIRISIAEHRIILTRDISMLKVKSVTHGYFVRNQQPKMQLSEVLNHFDLYQAFDPFSRCIKCNGKLERIEKEKIIQKLEPLTREYFDTFFRCLDCQSIYWEGSHFDRIKSFIDTIRNSREK
ncbi:MAG: Mut7-C RNAse domain-containing protein [Lentimicrobiaceae bacterium]|jgi:hypothetical protein